MHAACIAERMLKDGLMVRVCVRAPCIHMCLFCAYVRAWVGGCIAERFYALSPCLMTLVQCLCE